MHMVPTGVNGTTGMLKVVCLSALAVWVFSKQQWVISTHGDLYNMEFAVSEFPICPDPVQHLMCGPGAMCGG